MHKMCEMDFLVKPFEIYHLCCNWYLDSNSGEDTFVIDKGKILG